MESMCNKLKNTCRLRLLFMLLALIPIGIYAQNITIQGNVKDKEGEPIIGASVMERGTQNGTITDYDGNFSLSVSSKAKRIVVSFIGMKSQEVDMLQGREMKIILEDDAVALEDIVVIGYGTARRADLTGSVASIGEKALKDIPVASALEAIKGQLPGVNVTTTEGSPDAEIKIRIRGGGSITQDNTPLFIVDGFEVNSISDIPPGDIQSIDVLKDASSTAIYGSQGANGVVVITTKSGQAGRTTINFNAYAGIKKVYNLYDVLSPYEYVYYQRELDSGDSFLSTYGLWKDIGIYRAKSGENWQEQLYGNTGVQQNYNVSISGGSEKTRYNLSYTHDDEDYIMLNSTYKRDNIMLKVNHNISKVLDVDFTVRMTNNDITGPSVSSGKKLKDAVKYAPVKSLTSLSLEQLEDQDDSTEGLSSLNNPIDDVVNEYKKQNKFSNSYNAGVTWKIIKPLRFRSQAMYTFNKNYTDNIWLSGTGESKSNGGQPVAKRTEYKGNAWSIQNTLTYDQRFNKNHRLTVVIGQEAKHTQTDEMLIHSKFYPADFTADDVLAMWNYGTSQPTYTTIGEPVRTFSFFGRANYNFMDRYIFTVTARADGKNVFAPGNRWGYFPGVAGVWRISEEDFLKEQDYWLSNLKLRLSYGLVGNARVGSYWRQEYSFETSESKLYYPNENPASSLKPSQTLYNKDLTWETKVSANLGIDFGFFDERLSGTVDLYNDITKDLIMQVPMPTYSGYNYQYQNVGQTSNRGIEFSLNANLINRRDFTLSANFNIAFNRNRIDRFVSEDGDFSLYSSGWGLTTSTYDYLVQEGKPIGQMYGYVTEGMYSFDDFTWDNSSKKWILNEGVVDASELISSSGSYFGPGHIKLKDLDGDGVITEDDRKVIGNAQPNHTGGFGFNMTWKGFDLSALFNWSYGNDIYNANKIEFTTYSGSKKYQNLSTIMTKENRFTTIDPITGQNIYYGNNANPERLIELNTNATIWHPITNQTFFHSWAVEDGSLLRLSNLTIGYTLPQYITRKVLIQNLRFYATGYNLYCWTKYSGQDPEVDTRRSTPLTPGVDYSAYPKARTFIFGVNITF